MEKVAKIINEIGNVLILNIIFLLTSALTLGFGIGTAWSSLLGTFMDLKTDDTGYYLRNYFKHFKQEFKGTIAANIILMLVIVGAYFLLTMIGNVINDSTLKIILIVITLAVLLEIALVASFFYPVSVKFQGDMINHLYLAFLFAHRYILCSLLFVAAFVGSLYLCVYVSFAFLFVLYGALAYIEAKALKYLWRNYTYEEQS